MLELFEKLINERGSSTILRERLMVLKDGYADIEKACENLKAENKALEAELVKHRQRADLAEASLARLNSGAYAKYVCDHCGSPKLKRTGNRPDPIFGDLGKKEQVFFCEACGNESAFLEHP